MRIEDSTELERQRMLKMGMVEVKPAELKQMLDYLGYEIDIAHSFNYINGSNSITYKAKSVSIRHKDSKLSFAHVDCDRSKLPELQNVRMNYFVFNNGYIWEL